MPFILGNPSLKQIKMDDHPLIKKWPNEICNFDSIAFSTALLSNIHTGLSY